MASQPPSNEAFLREVDEELRRDQMAGFWKRWGRWVAVAVIVALVAFAGWLWWQHEQSKKNDVLGEQMTQILDDLEAGKENGIDARLKPLLDSGNPGYRATARFTAAGIKLQKNDLKGAAADFKLVADDAAVAKPFRDLALVRQTATEFDSLKPDVVIARLKPLAQRGNPWFGSAGEMVAVSYINSNQPKLAGALFAEISKDKGVPETIRSRAVQMAGVLGVDAVEQSAGEGK